MQEQAYEKSQKYKEGKYILERYGCCAGCFNIFRLFKTTIYSLSFRTYLCTNKLAEQK